MRNLLLTILTILLLESLLPRCANPKAPLGGPMDTIPPILLNTYPPIGQLNFEGREIILEFDERVTGDRLTSNLIITPQLDIKYKTTAKKNSLILKFEEDFPDSTTVTLNFFDGVTDVTEKNPAVNLSYVFSTGDFLDSMEVHGDVYDLLNGEKLEGQVVGLYPYSDTLDLLSVKPMYFTTSNEFGKFSIRNIKNGLYKILSFDDQNRNLQFEASSESHGFLSGTIQLDSIVTGLSIPIQSMNSSSLELISSRPLGNYFDVRYSKGLDSISINQDFDHNFLSETNTIRFYRPETLTLSDSIETFITVRDSVRSVRTDSVFVKFSESTRRPASFDMTLSPGSGNIKPQQNFILNFNKPIATIDTSLFSFKKDSLITVSLDSITTNFNNTAITIHQKFDTLKYFSDLKSIEDSLNSLLDAAQSDSLQSNDPDSLLTNSLDTLNNETSFKSKTRRISLKQTIQFEYQNGAFISIESDTIPSGVHEYSFERTKDNGTINLITNTTYPSYVIEVIDKRYNTIQTYPAASKLSLSLSPGEYGFRILIDENNDGRWSKGNFLRDLEPESVYVHPDFTQLRSNWDLTINISF